MRRLELSIGFEGGFYQGDIPELIDDLDTSGGRAIEAADHHKATGLEVRDVVVAQHPSAWDQLQLSGLQSYV